MAATLAKAMGTAHNRNTILGMAPRLIAGDVFDRAFFRTPFKSASVNLPTNCMFVVIPIDGLGPGSYARRFYAQAEQSSSVERLSLINELQKFIDPFGAERDAMHQSKPDFSTPYSPA